MASNRLLQREPYDESSAASHPVLDPRLAAERCRVFGDKRKAEPRADPMAGCRAAGEPFENSLSFASGDTWAGVLDDHQQCRTVRLDGDQRRSATVMSGVVEQVGKDSFEPQFVDQDRLVRTRPHLDRNVTEPISLGDAADEVIALA